LVRLIIEIVSTCLLWLQQSPLPFEKGFDGPTILGKELVALPIL
jgi:hypothetical protein